MSMTSCYLILVAILIEIKQNKKRVKEIYENKFNLSPEMVEESAGEMKSLERLNYVALNEFEGYALSQNFDPERIKKLRKEFLGD